jgi:hypothetical protein
MIMKISKENADRGFILLAGVTGTFILLMADLCTENPTIYKAGSLLSKHLDIGQHDDGSINYSLLLIVLLMGLIICWIYEPKTKVDAFIRGMSIFAVLSLAPPVDIKTSQPVNETSLEINQVPVKNQDVESDNIHTRPYADPQEMKVWNASYKEAGTGYGLSNKALFEVTANATIIYNEWVSSNRPETNAMSFFTNSIDIQKIPFGNGYLALPNGIRVQIIDTYDTSLRGYRYLHIKFYYYNRLWDGWIYSGKKPNYYVNVSLDR